jgi:hypothetical protein
MCRDLINYAAVLVHVLDSRDEGLAAAAQGGRFWTRSRSGVMDRSLGRYLHAAGEIGRGEAGLDRALAINPQHAWANFMLGNLLAGGRQGGYRGDFALPPRTAEQWRSAGAAMAEFTRGNDAASQQLLAKMERTHALGFAFPDRAGLRLARREGPGLRVA